MTAITYARVIRPSSPDNPIYRLAVVRTMTPREAWDRLGKPVVHPFEVAFGPVFDEAREHPEGEVWEVETDELPTHRRSYGSHELRRMEDDGYDLT